MSLFRKPKKPIQRRVFSGYDDEDEPAAGGPTGATASAPSSSGSQQQQSLLSFDDEEEEEVFQVKKTSQSKKVMKSLDKERRRKRHAEKNGSKNAPSSSSSSSKSKNNRDPSTTEDFDKDNLKKEKCENTSSNIQTEIRTDDFVLVVKKSDPKNPILNGRAALCAGRDDMSSEEEDDEEGESAGEGHHRFAKPDNFKMCLENGVIPDAAMIHAARKRRQKAREQGDFIPVEEPKDDESKKRVVREDGAGDGSDEDDDRIDMAAITGAKEREERREQFYSVQREDSADDSDMETKEWENQQIRKGVTGAQLVSAQQESVISQYMIQGFSQSSYQGIDEESLSTAALLEQAYARTTGLTKANTRAASARLISRVATGGQQEQKISGPRMPQEILKQLSGKLETTRELNYKHITDIEKITQEVKLLKLDHLQCEQKAPVAAAKYRFYQEMRCYVSDLVECLDEKIPPIVTLEQRALALMAKYSSMLIERRRQDVRDQAKEMADASKNFKRPQDDPDRVRRAAEREGRRTRRRRDREKNEQSDSHLDGMSSDDEVADIEITQHRAGLKEIALEAIHVFDDADEEFCEIGRILHKFQGWREAEMDSYKDAYVSLCLPKILGALIRLRHVSWNPVSGEDELNFEREDWYRRCVLYGSQSDDTEGSLAEDPDVRLIPTLVEKIVLPKLTVLIEQVWDPLSTTQTLKLVRLINRLSRDYPSLRRTCKQLRTLFQAILDKLKLAIDNDVFIPVFPKQLQEAKSSFFQRQFCSGLKLLRNITSWQGIIADGPLTELAIGSLINRYLLNGMRVCTPTDAINKASMIVYTLPRVWLTSGSSVVQSMDQFIAMLRHVENQLDPVISNHGELLEKIKKILASLHVVT
ncbi:PAX3- and PAX7-binding protein 1 isoform X2 [Toxorhynchites rutilus septentrionalis]|uniref:PAX3- and PAX7-binding protein 1 isoform X2 n=1 Tax=Toxorhynchites rutilus septentrionalis TaxID=329112 RepID=UPI0024795784|nr:PAX3- and PAX7-binding protein 1 isoform X2 [Toxorhynchites rutilus septentrionalis]